jgi:hypothetical protein
MGSFTRERGREQRRLSNRAIRENGSDNSFSAFVQVAAARNSNMEVAKREGGPFPPIVSRRCG